MFEKEAEEYRSHNTNYYEWDDFCADDGEAIEEAYQKGAEFGYNKAKEDVDKMKSQFLELCHLKDMRIEKLEKVNEWHYVKDGDLPELGVSCRVGVKAVYLNSYENIVPIECWFDGKDFVYWEDRKPVGWTKVSDFKGKVYAWKYDDELPAPPKESKNG